MSWETIILLGLVIAALLFVGRFLFAVLSLLALGFLILVGLALASDLSTGGNALEQLADKIAPVVAVWFAGLVAWIKQKTSTTQ